MPRSSTRERLPPLRLTFANNLRMARIGAGFSQERLAAEAGLDRTFVSSVERGVRNISIDNIELLAMTVGVPPQQLLDHEFANQTGLDPTALRAPRSARLYPASRKKSGG